MRYEDFVKTITPPKPPIGIMPENIWRRKRCEELTAAIQRYGAVGRVKETKEWISELSTHVGWLQVQEPNS